MGGWNWVVGNWEVKEYSKGTIPYLKHKYQKELDSFTMNADIQTEEIWYTIMKVIRFDYGQCISLIFAKIIRNSLNIERDRKIPIQGHCYIDTLQMYKALKLLDNPQLTSTDVSNLLRTLDGFWLSLPSNIRITRS
jgi:hypothetical protein